MITILAIRDLRANRIWALTIILLIALGSASYTAFRSARESGIETLDNVYKNLNYPDIIIELPPVKGVNLTKLVSRIPGVRLVSEAYENEGTLSLQGHTIPAIVIGVDHNHIVSNYDVIEGSDISTPNDVIVNVQFAARHHIRVGDELTLHVEGKIFKLRVSGIAFSPLFIFPYSPSIGVVNDLGVFYVSRSLLGNYTNVLYIKVYNNTNINNTIYELRTILKSKGIYTVTYSGTNAPARKYVLEDLNASDLFAYFTAFFLFTVISFLQFMLLARLVDKERKEIGVLKALGYKNYEVLAKYTLISVILSIYGIILSIPLSLILLYIIMKLWFSKVLMIPHNYITYEINLEYLMQASTTAFIASMLATFLPTRWAASLTPVNAMRPLLKLSLGFKAFYKKATSPLHKLSARSVLGFPLRSIGTIVAVALILSLGLSTALSIAAFQDAVHQRFTVNEQWSYRLYFDSMITNRNIINNIKNISGVVEIEPCLSSPASFAYKGRNTTALLTIIPKNSNLIKLKVNGSTSGLVISKDLAYRLNVDIGDSVVVTTPLGESKVEVTGILNEFALSEAYLVKSNVSSYNVVLVRETGSMNKDVFMHVPHVVLVLSREDILGGWMSILRYYIGIVYIMDMVMTILSIISIIIITYIIIRENEWNYIILKTLGYKNKKILKSLIIILLPLIIIGTLIGIPLSIKLATIFNNSFNNIISIPPTRADPRIIIPHIALITIISILSIIVISNIKLKENILEKIRNTYETL